MHVGGFRRQLVAGVRTFLLLSVLLGLAWPLALTGFAHLVARDQATGSLIERDGRPVGSRHIGQRFEGPTWFHGRPSVSDNAGDTSGGSNLSPVGADHLDAVATRRAEVVAANPGTDPAAVPADALSASGSGLDPDISPAYAALQVERVAHARRLDPALVRRLVDELTQGRVVGFLGAPRVNVLELNLALSAASPGVGS